MSNLDWGSFFRNVLGNRRPETDDTFALPSFDESDSDENDFAVQFSSTPWTSDTQVDLTSTENLNPDAEDIAEDDDEEDKLIYIGNLPRNILEARIIEFLHDLAEDQACEFLISEISRPRFGHTQAYAFVKCPTARLAQNLIQKTRDRVVQVDGRHIRIERPYPHAIRRLASRRGRSRRRSSVNRVMEPRWLSAGRPFMAMAVAGEANDDNDDDATSNSSDNIILDHDYFDFATFSPPPIFARRSSPYLIDRQQDQVSLSGTNRSSVYAQLRQDAERQMQRLERELSTKLSSTESKFRSLDETKMSKEKKKRDALLQLERIQLSISKLDLEIAEVDADRNVAEESLKQFIEDHEIKVHAVRDRLQQLRLERLGSSATSSSSTPEADPNANRVSDPEVSNGFQDPEPGVSGWARDELECICCVEKMFSPIYQCVHGHLICNNCHTRLTSCPVCRERYSTPIRSRIAEALVEKIARNSGNE